ncbi:MAG: hypothetical protein ACXWVP_11595 [Burkholderiales bacterium]
MIAHPAFLVLASYHLEQEPPGESEKAEAKEQQRKEDAGPNETETATGAVTLIQCFGAAVNLNIHLHALVAFPSADSNDNRMAASAEVLAAKPFSRASA